MCKNVVFDLTEINWMKETSDKNEMDKKDSSEILI